MTDRRALLLIGGCVFLAAVILVELSAGGDDKAAVTKVPTRAVDAPSVPRAPRAPLDKLLAATLARPLFNPTRRPPERSGPTASEIRDKRLAGIVIEPNQRIAIFAVAGAKSLALSEGETVDGWRVESITPREVSLRGPSGTETFQPKLDPNLVPRARAQLPARPTNQPAVTPAPRGVTPRPAGAMLPLNPTRLGRDQ